MTLDPALMKAAEADLSPGKDALCVKLRKAQTEAYRMATITPALPGYVRPPYMPQPNPDASWVYISYDPENQAYVVGTYDPQPTTASGRWGKSFSSKVFFKLVPASVGLQGDDGKINMFDLIPVCIRCGFWKKDELTDFGPIMKRILAFAGEAAQRLRDAQRAMLVLVQGGVPGGRQGSVGVQWGTSNLALAQIFGLDLVKEGVLPMLHPCCFGHPVLFKNLQQAESEQVTGWDNNLCQFWKAAIDQDSPARFTWHSDGAAHGFNEQGHQEQRSARIALVADVNNKASPGSKNNAAALWELLPSTPTEVTLKSGATVIVASDKPGDKVMTLEQVQAALDGLERVQRGGARKALVADVNKTASPGSKNNAAALWELLPSTPTEVTLKSGVTVIVASDKPGDKVMTLEQVQAALDGLEGVQRGGARKALVAHFIKTASPGSKNNAAALWELLPSTPTEVTLKSGVTVIVASDKPGDKVMTLEQVQAALDGLEGLHQGRARKALVADVNNKASPGCLPRGVAEVEAVLKASGCLHHDGARTHETSKSSYTIFHLGIKAMSPQIEERAIFERVYDMWQRMPIEEKASYRAEARKLLATAEPDLAMEARVAWDEASDLLQAMVQFLPPGPDLWAQDKTTRQLGVSYRRRREITVSDRKRRENAENGDKGSEAKKDPNEPTRAKSSYMLFCDEQRAKVKAENPALSMTEMSKVIGAKWKELSAEEKKPFEDKAKKLAAQYKEDKAKYDEENPQEKKRKGEGSEGKKSKKAKKDPNAPKGKLSAYMIWCATEREKIKEAEPTLKQTEIMAKLGQLWRDMSADDKKPWEEKAKADKERFDEETKSYKAPGGGEGSKNGQKGQDERR